MRVDDEMLRIDCDQRFKIKGGNYNGRLAIRKRSYGSMEFDRLRLGESKNGVRSDGRRIPRGYGRSNGLIDSLIRYDCLRGVKNKGRSSKMEGFEGHRRNSDLRRNGDLVRRVCLRDSKNWGRSGKSERVHGHLWNVGRVFVGLDGFVRLVRVTFSWFGMCECLLGCDELKGFRHGVSTNFTGRLNRRDRSLVVDSRGDRWLEWDGRCCCKVLRNMGDASDLGLGREYDRSIKSRGVSDHLGGRRRWILVAERPVD